VTDQGLTFLTSMQNLRQLALLKTAITDEAIPILAKIPNLEQVGLGPEVSHKGLKQLKTLRPLLKTRVL